MANMAKRLVILMLCSVLLLLPAAGADYGMEDVVSSVLKIPDQGGFSVGAKGAVLIEAESGRVLFAQNAGERLPMASTTKILTALITLEQEGLDEPFVVDPEAIRVEGSSMGLVEGDIVTFRALAVGMLTASGNDAANAAAVHISGSVPAFVDLMNIRAAEIGLMDTSFETPSGLDGEYHYSTAYDMAILAREALKNTDFYDICSQSSVKTAFGNPPYARSLSNHNRLLKIYDPAVGVKTGFTKKAGRCLVSAAEQDGVRLIAVTLKCPDDWNVHRNLYETYFGKLSRTDLSTDLPDISLPVTGGDRGQAVILPYGDTTAPLAEGEKGQVLCQIEVPRFVYAPVQANDVVGNAKYYLDGYLLADIPLIAAHNVELLYPYEEPKPEPDPWEWLKDWFSSLL